MKIQDVENFSVSPTSQNLTKHFWKGFLVEPRTFQKPHFIEHAYYIFCIYENISKIIFNNKDMSAKLRGKLQEFNTFFSLAKPLQQKALK